MFVMNSAERALGVITRIFEYMAALKLFFFSFFLFCGLWVKLLSSAGVAVNRGGRLYLLMESQIIWNL